MSVKISMAVSEETGSPQRGSLVRNFKGNDQCMVLPLAQAAAPMVLAWNTRPHGFSRPSLFHDRLRGR